MTNSAKSLPYWKDRLLKSSNRSLLAAILTILALVTFFKVKPYFEDRPKVTAFVRESARKGDPSGNESSRERADNMTWNFTEIFGGKGAKGRGATSGVSGNGTVLSRDGVPRVLTRPLFDGKSVVLRVRLLAELDSSSGEPGIEGAILDAVGADLSAMDLQSVRGATIRGTVAPNFETKRFTARFTEVLSTDGKNIPVAGVAFNPADSSLGIPSDYSSGLPSRLVGSALNRVIVAADSVAESRVLDNNGDSPVDRELGQMARQGSSEAANGLGDEATKSLRETKALLKVRAGDVFYVKIQATRATGVGP